VFRWGIARDVGTFANKRGKSMNGFDDCGVIASAGHIHRGFEVIADSGRQAIKTTADFDLHLIQLTTNILVGFESLPPLNAP